MVNLKKVFNYMLIKELIKITAMVSITLSACYLVNSEQTRIANLSKVVITK